MPRRAPANATTATSLTIPEAFLVDESSAFMTGMDDTDDCVATGRAVVVR
jgi:hypothetical protein